LLKKVVEKLFSLCWQRLRGHDDLQKVKPFSDGHLALYVAKVNCCP
jgi:hypothetical protein